MRSTFSGGLSRKFLKRTKVYYFVPRKPRFVKKWGSPPEGPCWKDPCGRYEKYFFRGSFKKVPKKNKSVLFCSKEAKVRKKLGFTPGGYRIVYAIIGFLRNSIGLKTPRKKLGFTPVGQYREFDI
jgi:hypothetical protein